MATLNQIKKFIAELSPIVQDKCAAHGWGVVSAIVAQAGLESAWGTSGLSTTCFNLWGMKYKEGCGTSYKEYKTGEQAKDGTYYTVTAKFRKYSSLVEGVEGYFKFIESYSRYKPVMAAKTYEDYAKQLKACGWATSIKYAQNIINTVEKYSLSELDGGASAVPTKQKVSSVDGFPVLRKGSKGDYVRVLQTALNYHNIRNGSLTVDCVFGSQTELSVLEFQGLHNLVKDGIVGKQTWSALML